MTTTILHCSDLHFGAIVDTAVRALVDVAHRPDVDVVVVTGDVTQRCRDDEIAGFRSFLHEVSGKPVLVCAGNHDVDWWPPWRRVLDPLHSFNSCVPEDCRDVDRVIGDVAFAAVPSVDPRRQVRGTHKRKATRSLSSAWPAEKKLRVAYTHHPIALDRPAHPKDIVTNAAHSAVVLADAGVDVLLSGHVHVPFELTTEVPFPSLSRSFVLIGAGTTTSWRLRGEQPRALHLIRADVDVVAVERWEMGPAHPAFGHAGTTTFDRTERGWRVRS